MALDIHTILERFHTIQNPTSAEKLDLLIDYCGVQDGDRVLDIGCGKGWLLRRIAARYAIEGIGVDVRESFIAEGQREEEASPGRGRVSLHVGDARHFAVEPGSFDVALCIGASFAIGTFEELLAWIQPLVRPGGVLAVGDIYARSAPLPAASAAHFDGGAERTLADTAALFQDNGFELLGIIDSTVQDWDHYESQHWRAAAVWATENPDHPQRDEFLSQSEAYKWEYLQVHRENLGWALFVAQVLS